jgi:hypothetical protein
MTGESGRPLFSSRPGEGKPMPRRSEPRRTCGGSRIGSICDPEYSVSRRESASGLCRWESDDVTSLSRGGDVVSGTAGSRGGALVAGTAGAEEAVRSVVEGSVRAGRSAGAAAGTAGAGCAVMAGIGECGSGRSAGQGCPMVLGTGGAVGSAIGEAAGRSAR